MPRPFQPLKKINNSSGINERFCIKMRVFSRDSDSRNSVSFSLRETSCEIQFLTHKERINGTNEETTNGRNIHACISLVHWTPMGCFSKESEQGVVMESGERLQAGRNFSI